MKIEDTIYREKLKKEGFVENSPKNNYIYMHIFKVIYKICMKIFLDNLWELYMFFPQKKPINARKKNK